MVYSAFVMVSSNPTLLSRNSRRVTGNRTLLARCGVVCPLLVVVAVVVAVVDCVLDIDDVVDAVVVAGDACFAPIEFDFVNDVAANGRIVVDEEADDVVASCEIGGVRRTTAKKNYKQLTKFNDCSNTSRWFESSWF